MFSDIELLIIIVGILAILLIMLRVKVFSNTNPEEPLTLQERRLLAEKREKQSNCKHEHYTVMGHELIGRATCLDCDKEQRAYIFHNLQYERMSKLCDKVEQMIKENEKV